MSDPVARINTALEGRYAIERELGEGGMATVYLAEDLKHHRKVALKVLKSELAAVVGAERFLAEITTTANLTHPHILPLHDSGEADGFLFYVMPHIEGESLRERIDREKQLGVDDAVAITQKVADALDYAHEHGVVHRDIKPGNILLSERGEPLIADFGIALAVGAAGGGRLTETGLSLGTPHYMSPEQATGDQSVGAATDMYALGCVLYEMLVGEPPYTGSTAQVVLGKIIAGKLASATEERASVPGNVDAAIRKALEKVPADRFRGAGEFVRALDDPAFRHGSVVEAGIAPAAETWNRVTVAATALAAVFGVLAGWSFLRPAPAQPVLRTEIMVPDTFGLIFGQGVNLTVSPDGLRIVFVRATADGRGQLWLRALDELSPVPIPGTENARSPRFSPDGEAVVFAVNDRLATVSLSGAPPQTFDFEVSASAQIPAWGSDGMIYFTGTGGGIWRVPVVGGEPERVTEVTPGGQVREHVAPEVLPERKGILFTRIFNVASGTSINDIAVAGLGAAQVRVLFPGTMVRYARSGHIVYTTADGTLLAAPFDPDRLEAGPARTLVEGIRTERPYSYFALSDAGALVYVPRITGGQSTELVWVTRAGDATPVEAGWQFDLPNANFGWRLSPTGERVAVAAVNDGNTDIWIKRLPDGPFELLTDSDGEDTYPSWTPDGEHVTYSSQAGGTDFAIWRRRADGTGTAEMVIDHPRGLLDGSWHPDGEWMVARTVAFPPATAERDVVGFRSSVDSVAMPLIATDDFAEQGPSLSRNGRWLAYVSNRVGQPEVYVRPFPDVESASETVSTNGGTAPVWAHSGTEMFFVDADRTLVSVQVETESNFQVLGREPLFTLGPEYRATFGGSSNFYDVSRDDQRFLMGRFVGTAALSGDSSRRFILVQNFFEELKRLVPN